MLLFGSRYQQTCYFIITGVCYSLLLLRQDLTTASSATAKSFGHYYTPDSVETRWSSTNALPMLQIAVHSFNVINSSLLHNLTNPFVWLKLHQVHNIINSAPDLNCTTLFQIVRQIGVNGAWAVVPMRHWHALSQVIAEHVLLTQGSVPVMFRVLDFFLRQGVKLKKTFNSFGIVHGAAWYIIGSSPMNALDWHWVFNNLSTHFFPQVLHGLGHGLLIKHTDAKYDVCSRPPTSLLLPELQVAIPECASAPFSLAALECSEGLFHAFVEYTDYRYFSEAGVINWMHPCQEIILSAYCFQYIFGQGLFYHNSKIGVTRRFHAMMEYPGHITTICLTPRSMRSEANHRGCIWGMSATAFLQYHEAWAARQADASKASPIKACLQIPPLTVNALPAVTCKLLLKNGMQHEQGNSSLISWCSLFVKPRSQDDMTRSDWQRWVTCLHGAAWSTGRALSAAGVPDNQVQPLCSHDFPAHAGRLWKIVEEFCSFMLPFKFESKFPEYGRTGWNHSVYPSQALESLMLQEILPPLPL